MTTAADIERARNSGASADVIKRLEEEYEENRATIASLSQPEAVTRIPLTMDEFITQYFPEIEPGISPFGVDVLVQLKTAQLMSGGGIALVGETVEVNNENTMVARVIRIGPIAYRNRDTAKLWPEGVWAKPGDVVLVPKWGGFRFERTLPDGNKARFCIFKDLEIRGGLNEWFEGLEDVQ